ncbi:MAG: hypothetical protein ACMZ7B_11735 [Balneola sp.]
MPTNLESFFTYNGNPDEDGFYDLIKDCQNSMLCHKVILELFMNALKLSSLRYRGQPEPTIWPPGIPNEASLDDILTYIPEEVKDPMEQVFFEQWKNTPDGDEIGNNAWYVETYAGSVGGAGVPVSLQAAMNFVRAAYYTGEYNDLQKIYDEKGWSVTDIPEPLPNSDTQDPPTKADVITFCGELKTWIQKNDPEVIALTNLQDATTYGDADAILTAILGASPIANVDIPDFCTALVNEIEATNKSGLPSTIGARRQLIRSSLAEINKGGSVWNTCENLKALTQQFTAKSENQWRLIPSKAFTLINNLFYTGLTLADQTDADSAKASILQIFKDFQSSFSVTTYLFQELNNTCSEQIKIIIPDLATLDAWSNEINDPIPKTIHYSNIELLMKSVCDILENIPLTYNGSDANLFSFTDYDNINAYSSWEDGNSLTSDTLKIFPDAVEYEPDPHFDVPTPIDQPFRPVYGIFTYGEDTYFKFFNVGSVITDGSFYFENTSNPTLVETDYYPGSSASGALTIELGICEINDKDTVPFGGIKGITLEGTESTMPSGTVYKEQNGKSISKQNFFAAIRLLSKWKDLNGQRSYQVLYSTIPGEDNYDTHLIWYVASGNLDRTDKVDDSLCLWQWLASEENSESYGRLPEILGLPLDREIIGKSAEQIWPGVSMEATIGGETFYVEDYTPLKFFNFNITGISIYKPATSKPFETYIETNTPCPNLPSEIDAILKRDTKKGDLSEEADLILQLFNFSYYRRSANVGSTNKVIKWVPAKYRPDDLDDGIDLGDEGQPQNRNAIGINQPISLRSNTNALHFKKYTGPDGSAHTSLKNKGNPLYKTKGKREPAGKVMAKLKDHVSGGLTTFPIKNSSLSATGFGDWVLENSEDHVLEEWKELKSTNQSELPTNQEWCHLLGHGDSGDERLGNFVSGSFHCNTEQLAMESKERRSITQQAPKGKYHLRSTAYLFNDDHKLLKDDYLTNDAAYQKMVKVYSALQVKKGKTMKLTGAGTVMPLAAFFRYKIYGSFDSDGEDAAAGSQVELKLFDHIFEGQSEFIDQHQFNILKHAAWFCVAGMDAFDKWYKEQVVALNAKMETE